MTIGIDEVGRGCWAGPLVAGAVLLRKPIAGLTDSKKLSVKQREKLSELILESAECGIGWVTPTEVDDLGLTKAVEVAMRRAVKQIAHEDHKIIIDGNINYLRDLNNTSCLVKADDKVPEVSAASIIAKVARDRYMYEMAEQYPGYLFETNVGYGTTAHLEGLKVLGVTKLHRMSYKPVKALCPPEVFSRPNVNRKEMLN